MVKVKKNEPSQEELQTVFEYDPDTGIFVNMNNRSPTALKGQLAGCIGNHGYRIIVHKKQHYKAHRLAWIYMFGSIPEGLYIDHKDMDKLNNKISNLRLCTKSENHLNRGKQTNNVSGHKGVTWCNNTNKWKADARLKGEYHYLGIYEDIEDAIKARTDFCLAHHGEFYREVSQ